MFGYVYSVLLLAVTKPACDHVIRMITKNHDASASAINCQLQKLTTELIKQGKSPEQIEDIAKDLVKLREELEKVREMVLENRIAAHDDAISLHNEHVQMHVGKKLC